MSIRAWITLITLALLSLVIYLGWPEIVRAFGLIGKVNPWILALLLPIQFLSYFCDGESMFSYLRAKGELKGLNRFYTARTSLEMNFVNQIFPLPAAGGFSYITWVLSRYGVSHGRSAMAQIIRQFSQFFAFASIIIISVFVLLFDHNASNFTIFISTLFFVGIIGLILFTIYIISSRKRIMTVSRWTTKFINLLIKILVKKEKQKKINLDKVSRFFIDLHEDYLEIKRDRRILIKPLLWSTAESILDVSLIMVAFLSLGFFINPAALIVAYGIACFVTVIFAVLPGGAGVYETAMITFLASAGVAADVAIAGTLLARAVLLMATIIFGYVFYQLTINKYGKIDKPTNT
jgi:putative heme transporter